MKRAYLSFILASALLLSGCGDETASATAGVQASALPTELKDADTYSGDNAYVHCAALCALGPRSSGSPAYEAQVRYLSQQLEKAGWQVRVQPFEPIPGRKMQNVHATYGSTGSQRPLLITCHIDTKGQGSEAILGADDGASGAAAILELARVLAREPELAARVELVFFDGEESFGSHITETDGLYGSRYDVQQREVLPLYLINLDMVGGAGKTIRVPVLDTSQEMFSHYMRAIETLGFSEDRWSLYPGSFWDDHRPYVEAGVETLNLIGEFSHSGWWHTMRDDMSRISPASLGETGRMTLQLIRQIIAPDATAEGADNQSS